MAKSTTLNQLFHRFQDAGTIEMKSKSELMR